MCPRITSIAAPTVDKDSVVSAPVPRNLEVSELKIKTLRVNLSNGLISVDGDKGVLEPLPDKVPRANALGLIDDGWLTANIVRDPATVVRTTDTATIATEDAVLRARADGTIDDAWLTERIVRTEDSRLTDDRYPTSHAASHGIGGSDTITPHAIGAPAMDDPRLSDERYPTQHAAAHQHGGAMEIGVEVSGAHTIPKADAAGHLDMSYLNEDVKDTLHKARMLYLDKVIGLGIYE